MFTGSRLLATLIVLISTASLGAARAGQAPAASPTPDTIAALLVEVRGLRAAMEQIAAAGPRVQLALGRLQLQEQRINTLVRRLEDVRANLIPARQKLDEATDQVSRLEKGSRESLNAEERRDMEEALPRVKRNAKQAASEIQRLQGDESSLLQDITSEQNRWTEFNLRLEELERALPRR
jgi:predicted  nucleic acid-binding Zn-ribbon protein